MRTHRVLLCLAVLLTVPFVTAGCGGDAAPQITNEELRWDEGRWDEGRWD